MLLKKAVLYRNIAQNWAVKTEQLIQYYNTKFSPVTEVKNLKRLVNFSWEKVDNLEIKTLKNFGNLTA